MKKKILFISILFMCFFINIQGVSAKKSKEAKQTTCTWELPYTGIWKDGLETSSELGNAVKQSYTVTYRGDQKVEWEKKSWFGNVEKFHSNNLRNDKDYIKSGKCPDYIVLKEKVDDQVQAASASDLLNSKNGLHIHYNCGSNPFQQDYSISGFLLNRILPNIPFDSTTTGFAKSCAYEIYLPLVTQNQSTKSKPITKFQEKVIEYYTNVMSNDKAKLQSYCGDSDSYLDKDNYSDKPDFLTYVKGSYAGTEKAVKDATISEQCWNQRQTSIEYRNLITNYFKTLSATFKGYSDINKLMELKKYSDLPISGGVEAQQKVDEEKNEINEKAAAAKLQEDLQKNSCLALCQTTTTTSSTPVEECKKGTGYKNCYNALKKCKEKYNLNVKDDKITAEVNTCMKDEMGEEAFETLQNRYSTLMNSLDVYALKKAKVPKLNVKYTKNYKVECSDIKYLHQFWVAIEIISPILVIVFGSLDFAKSVMAGDEKKIKDSRVNFIKRLAAAILLLLTFAIVSVLVNLTNNDDVKDTSLIKCIVDGK